MSYVMQAQKPNPAAMIGALGVPAAFGALLVVGLAITVTAVEEDDGLIGIFVPTPPPPMPTPTPTVTPTEVPPTEQSNSEITAPESPFDFPMPPAQPDKPMPPSDPLPPGPTPGMGNGMGAGTGTPSDPKPTPRPTPKLFDPVSAVPRGNPGGWITTSDYRSAWIRREMTGSASFVLQISASGKVTGCSITSSTGHSALDDATCKLLQRRARFEPARDTTGATVAGTYRSSITWRLPE